MFDGKDEDYMMWWVRFQAYAEVKMFASALQDGGEPSLPKKHDDVLDMATDAGKKSYAALKHNNVAMATMTMAFSTQGLMNLIAKAKDNKFPMGRAHLVAEALKDKYMPKDIVTKVELQMALNQISMKDNENPDVLFQRISAVENWFNTSTQKVDESDLIAVVLSCAPHKYQTVLTVEKRVKGSNLKMKDLNDAMKDLWRQSNPMKMEFLNEKKWKLRR